MVKVKTFGEALKVFQTHRELDELDERVNKFIKDNNVTKVVSVSDAVVPGEGGVAQGVIRVLAYE
jgi:hypothetical protein